MFDIRRDQLRFIMQISVLEQNKDIWCEQCILKNVSSSWLLAKPPTGAVQEEQIGFSYIPIQPQVRTAY